MLNRKYFPAFQQSKILAKNSLSEVSFYTLSSTTLYFSEATSSPEPKAHVGAYIKFIYAPGVRRHFQTIFLL